MTTSEARAEHQKGLPLSLETGLRVQKGVGMDSPLDRSCTTRSCIQHPTPVSERKEQVCGSTLAAAAELYPVIDENHLLRPETGKQMRFFVIRHPRELKDKTEMRKNRQHVMLDYLEKTRCTSDETDIKAGGLIHARKRTCVASPPGGTALNPAAASNVLCTDLPISPAESVPRCGSVGGSCPNFDHCLQAPKELLKTGARGEHADTHAVIRRSNIGNGRNCAPLVCGIKGRFKNSSYLGTSPEEVPFSPERLGTSLNPFNTWPSFSDHSIDVSRLKWQCSLRFGSKSMGQHWVPMLLQARHAFLSTICISSTHDDIMSGTTRSSSKRRKHESIERMAIRHEITHMVNEALDDRHMQTDDTTLIAVLHLLNAEVMGCKDAVIRVHQQGLHAMIQQRGGLHALGVKGQLAAVTTITEYIIAALWERRPHADYVRYALRQDTTIPKDGRKLPESPIYCRRSGFGSMRNVLPPDSMIYKMLESSRRLTNAFISGHARVSEVSGAGFPLDGRSCPILQMLASEVFSARPGAELAFRTPAERHTYEAIRLTSRVYAHALGNCLAFSKAATQLRASECKKTGETQVAIHVQIRDALVRTDTTDCWGHMTGVLFWIALVAGASANFGGSADRSNRTGLASSASEEGEARQWLAAVLVRCSIVLGFEFGSAVMETMKTIGGIQQALGLVPVPGQVGDAVDAVTFSCLPEAGSYGPDLPPAEREIRKGFVDFAQEFLALS